MKSAIEIKVGIFTLITSAVVLYMFSMLSPETFHSLVRKKYYTIIEDAGGVLSRTHVKTNGVVVGKVADVFLVGNNTRINIEVDKDVNIPKDSFIAIREKGMLGDVFIDIVRGDRGEFFSEQEMIPPLQGQMRMSSAIKSFGAVASNLEGITNNIKIMLNEDKDKIKESFRQMSRAINLFTNILENNHEDIGTIVSHSKSLVVSLENMLKNNSNKISKILDGLSNFSTDLNEAIVDDKAGTKRRNKLKDMLASFEKTLLSFQSVSQKLESISDKVEKGQGAVGKFISDEDFADNINDTFVNLKKMTDTLDNVHVLVDYHNEIDKADIQHSVNFSLHTSPNYSYIFGVTDKLYSTKETTIETVDEGSLYTKKEKIKQQPALHLNLQFAKRWGALQIRFGLFESSGGAGIDYNFVQDRLKLSLEAYQWDTRSSLRSVAHIKSYIRFLLFKHVYLMGGASDLTTKSSYKDQWFAGFGFVFDDDTLSNVPSLLGLTD